jgi:hypothetical protein
MNTDQALQAAARVMAAAGGRARAAGMSAGARAEASRAAATARWAGMSKAERSAAARRAAKARWAKGAANGKGDK